jgi:hypothetical protein
LAERKREQIGPQILLPAPAHAGGFREPPRSHRTSLGSRESGLRPAYIATQGAASVPLHACRLRCEQEEEAMDETSAATLVDEVYRTYRIDDRGPMLALLREDVVFRIEGDPDRLPFTGSGTVMPA